MSELPLLRNKSFIGLAGAQFLEAGNDNLFKMTVSLLAVDVLKDTNGGSYLSLSGALFALPYLLFSCYAGQLADAIAKRTVLVLCKVAEIVITMAAVFALAHAKWIEGLLFILFLMAAHSTFFSPAKYGSLPEIVPMRQLARANGILEASRYAAIIIGTAAGGVLMQMWRHAPERVGIVCVSIAVAGLACALLVQRVAPAEPSRSSGTPWASLAKGLKRISRSPSLSRPVISLAFFDGIATLTMLDVLMIGKLELHLGDAASGTVGAFAAIGAGIGALVYGHLSREKVELGMTPIAGLGIAASLLALGATANSYASIAALLFVLGVFAGLFVVPFVAWLQKTAGEGEKGLIISTANFIDMAGVLGASGVLWFLHDGLGLAPKTILCASGIATAAYVVVLTMTWKRLKSCLALFFRSFQLQLNPQ
ncbi:MAG TPA: MFS transporter [Micropepsaceae bacterium]|nr:MFS transporter [Micropepsaceae bacterium]